MKLSKDDIKMKQDMAMEAMNDAENRLHPYMCDELRHDILEAEMDQNNRRKLTVNKKKKMKKDSDEENAEEDDEDYDGASDDSDGDDGKKKKKNKDCQIF